MALNILLLLLALGAGLFAYIMGVSQIIMYFRCTKPYTALLSILYRGQIDSIIRVGRLSVAIWSGIIVAFLVGLWFIDNAFAWSGFLVGFLFPMILFTGSIGPNKSNFDDYMKTYGGCFESRLLEDYKAGKQILEDIAEFPLHKK